MKKVIRISDFGGKYSYREFNFSLNSMPISYGEPTQVDWNHDNEFIISRNGTSVTLHFVEVPTEQIFVEEMSVVFYLLEV